MPTIEEVKVFLEENKGKVEVEELLKGYVNPEKVINLEAFRKFAEANDEGKKFLNSYADSRVTGALKTYEEKTLIEKLKAHEEEVKKKYEVKETPEQKVLKEMQDKLLKMEMDSRKDKLKLHAITKAKEAKLPEFLIDHVDGESEEVVNTKIESLSKRWSETLESTVKAQVEERLKTKVRDPKDGGKSSPAADDALSDEEFFAKNKK